MAKKTTDHILQRIPGVIVTNSVNCAVMFSLKIL